MPLPYPVAPPPSESIKLQKVPESVRSAMEFRQPPSAFIGSYKSDSGFSFPSSGGSSLNAQAGFGAMLAAEGMPKTPAATRAPSPMPGSGSGSSPGSSKPGSLHVHSRMPSRQHSRDKVPAVLPVTSPVNVPALVPSSSAYAPLFPFTTSGPPGGSSSARRDRAASETLTASTSLDMAAVPVAEDMFNQGSLPNPYDGGAERMRSFAFGQGSFIPGDGVPATPPPTARAAHRTSIAPLGGLNPGDTGDDYAQIIMASRSAKLRKWKPSITSSNVPSDVSNVGNWAESEGALPEADLGLAAGELGGAGVEWVDWLDEYSKLKEAKMRAEKGDEAAESPVKDDKGKRKADQANEYPFHGTEDVPILGTSGFLTPGMSQYFPLTASASSPTAAHFPTSLTSTVSSSMLPPTSAPLEPALSRPPSHQPSIWSVRTSPTTGRRKTKLKGVGKIEAWWSSVRSSFSTTPGETHGGSSGLHLRRTSTDGIPSSFILEPQTPGHYLNPVRPQTPGTPTLRNAASVNDLARPARPPAALVPGGQAQTVPAGALAPAVRTDTGARLAPQAAGAQNRPSSGGSDSDNNTMKSDSKWRNPHLSLNLGPSFNALLPSKTSPIRPLFGRSASSGSPSTASIHDKYFSSTTQPAPEPGASQQERSPSSSFRRAQPTSQGPPGMTPGHAPMWDKTPGLVPTSSAFPIRPVVSATNKSYKGHNPKDPAFSMHTVHQQIRTRLSNAKENCDKELKRIIHGISTHVELELHKEELASPALDEGRFGELMAESEYESEALADEDPIQTDSDGGGTSRPPSRANRDLRSPLLAASVVSHRRPSTSRPSTRSTSPRRSSLQPRKRHLTSMPRNPDFGGYSLVGERGTPGSGSGTGSANSSRSNSRSRSPLPPPLRNASAKGDRSPVISNNSSNPILVQAGDDDSAFILVLQEIITVATEILDTAISKLTLQTGLCGDYIQRVQTIGKAWDESPELPCRGWYVQLLLAVAGLSRVVEWWEAERGFWTFDEADDENAEPILFVAKATDKGHNDSPEIQPRARGGSFAPASPLIQPAKWSPLGIDLGEESTDPARDADPLVARLDENATRKDADDLRQAVEEIRSQTLLMELSLVGEKIQYVSSAWEDLAGLTVDQCIECPISDFVFADDEAIFAEATRQLEADEGHTVTVTFRLRVATSSASSQDEGAEDYFEAMEGKGMLMKDSVTGHRSHTMWVIRPAPYQLGSEPHKSLTGYGLDGVQRHGLADSKAVDFASAVRLSTKPILCRICERPTPAWFFEKHNETCNETHKLESDIQKCNDELKELRSTVEELSHAIEDHGQDEAVEYGGIPLESPGPSRGQSPGGEFDGENFPASPDLEREAVHQAQQVVLDRVIEILETAISISTPTVAEETTTVPIQEQRLLSPTVSQLGC